MTQWGMHDAPTGRMDTFLGDGVGQLIREVHEPIDSIETADVSGFLERVGDARVVLLGGATHGTSEFYRWRARLTRELVANLGRALDEGLLL